MPKLDSVEKLNSQIQKAHAAISSTFGEKNSAKYNSLTYFQEEGLSFAYQKEEVFVNIAKELESFGKEIRSMRSSYLPIEFFREDGVLNPSLSDDLGKLESYENAFMRMLGMPSSEELEIAARSSENNLDSEFGSLNYISKNGDLITGASYIDIEDEILNERAKRKADRKVIVNNYIFDIDKKSISNITEDSSIEDGLEAQDSVIYPKLNEFENNPYVFSYLLFPPIKDARFSNCINEPEKIVAPLFSNPKTRQINSKRIKPTLIESIIRIRLDKLSGEAFQSSIKNSSAELTESNDLLSVGSSEDEDLLIPFGESYGILEALFVIRLRSAILGLAKKFSKDRDQIFATMSKLVLKISERDRNDDRNGTGSTQNNVAAKRESWENASLSEDLTEKKKLEDQLLIEDSMMALFGNNSGAIDLQKNTQRNSSIYEAHLMSGLIGIIDIPRERIRTRLSELEIKRNKNFIAQVEPIRASLNTIIGTDIGIGNIDMLIFSLALFTISEYHLLNLLSDSDYERLKSTSFGNVIDSITDRPIDGRIKAVNELTNLAYAGYQLFAKDIES